ncbi:MAG TPA: DUF429 domain-containing protein [Geminicoccaceae bacterium]|nr:DUF429 domain-containing protein [Geminicoccaceae bacterium]
MHPAEPIRIFGVDVTSRPSRRKPMTCAECRLEGGVLTLRRLHAWPDFAGLEALLRSKGPWLMALDVPFGQPRELVAGLGWPAAWPGYVAATAALSRAGWVTRLEAFRGARPPGRKEPKRVADRAARCVSAMKVGGIPAVGLMYYEVAPRLLAAPVSLLPTRPLAGVDRVAIEGYPALVKRRWLGDLPYKEGDPRDPRDQRRRAEHRRLLRRALAGPEAAAFYGFATVVPGLRLRGALARDASGDALDALLCAVQGAWAWLRRGRGFGIPPLAPVTEGWIVDPATLAAAAVEPRLAAAAAPGGAVPEPAAAGS